MDDEHYVPEDISPPRGIQLRSTACHYSAQLPGSSKIVTPDSAIQFTLRQVQLRPYKGFLHFLIVDQNREQSMPL